MNALIILSNISCELYRRVSDRETLGTVVGELRTTLGEAEQLLDQFLRAPDDRQPLETANTLLGQMRGVLMVLGLEPAAHAVSRMRESITSWQKTEGNPAQGNDEELEHFGNSLGALASLVDMMGYQPALAGELFFYDEESGELKYDASRAQPPQPLQEAGDVLSAEEPQQAASSAAEEVEDLLIERAPETLPGQLEELAGRAALEEKPALAQAARSAAEAARSDDGAALSQALDVLQSVAGTSPAEPQPHEQQEEPEEEPIDEGLDAELLEIFLEEAREVVQTGSAALQTLASAPGDMEQQTTLRRAFHTLKGSSRMVGLTSCATVPSACAFFNILLSARLTLPSVFANSWRMRASSGEAVSFTWPNLSRLCEMRRRRRPTPKPLPSGRGDLAAIIRERAG